MLDALGERAEIRTYERNELLFSQGDASNELFVVQTGRIAIATKSPDGRESVLAVLEDGALFGELPLFDDAPRVADARALSDSSVDRAPVRAGPERSAAAARAALDRRCASSRGGCAPPTRRSPTPCSSTCPARTAKRLLELAGDADEFKLPVTQEELAAMVGASRERVNKALALFGRLGWLEVKGRSRYKFLDRQALEDRADL